MANLNNKEIDVDYGFADALKAGLMGEAVAIEYIHNEAKAKNIDVTITKANDTEKDYDLIVEYNGITRFIEVKRDIWWENTHNLCLEMITKTDKVFKQYGRIGKYSETRDEIEDLINNKINLSNHFNKAKENIDWIFVYPTDDGDVVKYFPAKFLQAIMNKFYKDNMWHTDSSNNYKWSAVCCLFPESQWNIYKGEFFK